LVKELSETNKTWIIPALKYFHKLRHSPTEQRISPIAVSDLQNMMGWSV
jgi:hypothetical protein